MKKREIFYFLKREWLEYAKTIELHPHTVSFIENTSDIFKLFSPRRLSHLCNVITAYEEDIGLTVRVSIVTGKQS